MKKRLFLTIHSMALLFFFNTQGYIYQITAMVKQPGAAGGQKTTVIGLGDYHDKDHPANREQRAYLESFLKQCSKENTKLIVEDLSSVNSDGKGICCNYVISARGGVLGKLADAARFLGVDVDNVEYRFCRVVGLGPLLHNRSIDPKQLSTPQTLKVKSLYAEVAEEYDAITRYEDGYTINGIYKRFLSTIMKDFKALKTASAQDMYIADYCRQFINKNYVKNIERLCIFDSPLIDAKILHSIIMSHDKKVIIVAAGGSHIEKINSVLSGLGYEKLTLPVTPVRVQEDRQNMFVSGVKKSGQNSQIQAVSLSVLENIVTSSINKKSQD